MLLLEMGVGEGGDGGGGDEGGGGGSGCNRLETLACRKAVLGPLLCHLSPGRDTPCAMDNWGHDGKWATRGSRSG